MAWSPAALHVRRHAARYRVVGGGSGKAVGAALDFALTHALPHHLGQGAVAAAESAAARVNDTDDVWLVRRLDVRACVSPSWPAQRIARALAAATSQQLGDVLRRGPDGETVLWFPDRPAFLARYLADQAEGRTGDRWEYAEFAGCRDTVEREPGPVLEALLRLGPADRGRVLRALAPADSERVLRALATRPHAREEPAGLAIAALRRLLDAAELPDDRHRAALAIFLQAVHDAGPASEAVAQRAREVAGLLSALRRADANSLARICRALQRGDWASAPREAVGELVPLMGWPPRQRREAARVLTASLSGIPSTGTPPDTARLRTRLGGMFLLLPLLEELPWERATAGWPRLGEIEPARLAQYLAVVGALGSPRNATAAIDPVLRLALGLPADTSAAEMSAWSARIDPDAVAAASHRFLAHLGARGKASGSITVTGLLDGVLAVDGARGLWLGSAPADPQAIRELLQRIITALGTHVTVTGAQAWIAACLPPSIPPSEPIDPRHVVRLEAQASYACVGPPFTLVPTVGELTVRAAQALVRELAWRLPGFGRSTLGYLWDNILSFEAEVDIEPERFVVHLGNPPLQLVLSLAGMNRREFTLAATGDRTWTLVQRH